MLNEVKLLQNQQKSIKLLNAGIFHQNETQTNGFFQHFNLAQMTCTKHISPYKACRWLTGIHVAPRTGLDSRTGHCFGMCTTEILHDSQSGTHIMKQIPTKKSLGRINHVFGVFFICFLNLRCVIENPLKCFKNVIG